MKKPELVVQLESGLRLYSCEAVQRISTTKFQGDRVFVMAKTTQEASEKASKILAEECEIVFSEMDHIITLVPVYI